MASDTVNTCKILRLAYYCSIVTAVHCPALDTTYAELNSTDTEFGVTVNINCLPGYRINGQTTATVRCNSTGQWSLYATCLRTFYLTVMLNQTRKSYRASVAQCKVSAYAPSCRRCVATYWKDQTRRSQNCKYLR